MFIFIYILILCMLIYDSATVISGASYGLMLWYKNIVPILLPFMLISSLVVRSVANGKSKKTAVFSTVFLGVLCGYPIGARVSDEYVSLGIYKKKTGSILLPLCNNSSPMFISGYIVSFILKKQISFFTAMFIIYVPYIIVALISFSAELLYRKKHYDKTDKESNMNTLSVNSKNMSNSNDAMLNSVIQITYVGIYIMICSIITEFICKIDFIPQIYKIYLSGILEITRGTDMVYSAAIPMQIKTALIIAFTSFGGVSAILQTKKVISNSGLSIFHYIIIKTLCASMSFFLGILVI